MAWNVLSASEVPKLENTSLNETLYKKLRLEERLLRIAQSYKKFDDDVLQFAKGRRWTSGSLAYSGSPALTSHKSQVREIKLKIRSQFALCGAGPGRAGPPGPLIGSSIEWMT